MVLTNDQKKTCSVIENGHNVVVLGQAGTGKSYVINVIAASLEKAGKNVQITATTGIAASQFSNGLGRTIHSWSGIEDGRYSDDALAKTILSDTVRSAGIKNTDTLIIDEISMLSAKLFDQIELVCRHVRDSSLIFGGLQVVCFGDFFQLPPVPNEQYFDQGKYAFESEKWRKCITHKILLSTVVRQKDRTLINAIWELEKGVPSDITNDLMYRLDKPFPPGDSPTVLYGTNFEVDWHNSTTLEQLQGPLYIFKSEDSGSVKKALHKIIAKKILSLKVNCPVILLKNLTKDLVNGCIGQVIQVDEDGPIIKFKSKTVKLSRETFSVYDPLKKQVIAERSQFPVSLAYALTVHKSQGMTVERCEIHCTNIRNPGQMGVAVGRVTTLDGLRVIGYHPTNCVSHRKDVHVFCESEGTDFIPDLSCCRMVEVDFSYVEPACITEELFRDWSDDSEFDDHELQEIEKLEKSIELDSTKLLEVSDGEFSYEKLNSFIQKLISPYAITQSQKDFNNCLSTLQDNNKAKTFLNEQFLKIASFLPDTPVDKKEMPIQKQWNIFYTKFQSYLGSHEYKAACNTLAHPESPNYLVCGHILTALRKEHVESLKSGSKQLKSTHDIEIKNSAYGKIRYVGGRTVAKVKHKNMKIVRNAMQSGKLQDAHFMNKMKVEMLEAMTVSQHSILETTKYPDSTFDTFRKQNLTCGLTNINDGGFEFFRDIERKRIPLYHEFEIHGSEILMYVEKTIKSDSNMFETFIKLISKSGFSTSSCQYFNQDPTEFGTLETLKMSVVCAEELYNDIVHSYLSVTDNEFRRGVLEAMGKKKLMEHRKKVLTKHTKSSSGSSANLSMDFILKDQSKNKELSYLKLKTLILEKQVGLGMFTKNELVTIGNIYGVKLTGKKNIMIAKLESKILECESFISKKRDNPLEEINEICAKCGKMEMYYEEDEIPWIGCSNCDRWWHRTCCGLEKDEDWEKYSRVDESWNCPLCKK